MRRDQIDLNVDWGCWFFGVAWNDYHVSFSFGPFGLTYYFK